jgi:hypothetical protein
MARSTVARRPSFSGRDGRGTVRTGPSNHGAARPSVIGALSGLAAPLAVSTACQTGWNLLEPLHPLPRGATANAWPHCGWFRPSLIIRCDRCAGTDCLQRRGVGWTLACPATQAVLPCACTVLPLLRRQPSHCLLLCGGQSDSRPTLYCWHAITTDRCVSTSDGPCVRACVLHCDSPVPHFHSGIFSRFLVHLDFLSPHHS